MLSPEFVPRICVGGPHVSCCLQRRVVSGRERGAAAAGGLPVQEGQFAEGGGRGGTLDGNGVDHALEKEEKPLLAISKFCLAG